MDTKKIQEAADVAILKARLRHTEVRKKERRLLKRKIARLEAEIGRIEIEMEKQRQIEAEKPVKIHKKKEVVAGEPVKKPRAPRKKKAVE